ncbi:MAG: hypothetical protein CVU07_12250 [Bacteroidetes bacterium HGW-Bacteroidetes-23]|nr:MAG: hypothetical protein CVU07_12250 [Bacteroidetes bacterium HGW-Bacteroidetes-23]
METPIKIMKNIFISLAFMLIGSFAFANNAKQISTVNFNEALELIKKSSNYELVLNNSLVDCLLKITFVYEDGSSETIHVLVKGVSCEDILG